MACLQVERSSCFFSDLNKPVEEIEPACRQATLDNHAWMQEWMDRRSLEPHVFGDILEQVQKESIPERLDFFSRRDVVQTLPLKKNNSATLTANVASSQRQERRIWMLVGCPVKRILGLM